MEKAKMEKKTWYPTQIALNTICRVAFLFIQMKKICIFKVFPNKECAPYLLFTSYRLFSFNLPC